MTDGNKEQELANVSTALALAHERATQLAISATEAGKLPFQEKQEWEDLMSKIDELTSRLSQLSRTESH